MGRTVTVGVDVYGDEVMRIRLPEPYWAEDKPKHYTEIGTGVWLTAIYAGRKRAIIRTHSIWTTRDGGIVGTEYRLATADDLRMIERVIDADAAAAVAAVIGVKDQEL